MTRFRFFIFSKKVALQRLIGTLNGHWFLALGNSLDQKFCRFASIGLGTVTTAFYSRLFLEGHHGIPRPHFAMPWVMCTSAQFHYQISP